MTPGLRKLMLTAHVVTTVGWLGAVACFLALAIVGLSSRDAEMVRGAYLVMGPISRTVILPLAVASLLIGVGQALGTPWGLFRHYWVLFKLGLTAFSVGGLLVHMSVISLLSDAAAQATWTGADLRGERIQITIAAGVGLLVLVVINTLSVYKPRGRTRYGQRKQLEQRRQQREQIPATVPFATDKAADSEESALVSKTSATTRTLAAAGIAGPPLFTAGFLAQGFFRRDRYDTIAQQISDLTAGRYGWVQQLNFVVFGLLVIAFAVALQLVVRPARAGVVGPAVLGWNGLGLVVAGVFPLREDAAGRVYDPLGVHSMNGRIFFLSIGIALVAVYPRLRGDPRWRGLAVYTLVTGTALLALFVAVGALAVPPDGPLHAWLGLAQRLVLAVWFPCIVVLALRLRRVATEAGAA